LWDECSVQSVKEELWNAKVKPEVTYTSAVEWPTLQETMRAKQTRKGPSREYDDEWGGKVWDGVTDWFP
jgi:hypothetical protein